MLGGNIPREVAEFYYIDFNGEGVEVVTPDEGEIFVCIPYQYYSDDCTPFIEVVKNKTIIRTINCKGICDIVFK